MPRITTDTTVEELAAIVSQALHAKGITGTHWLIEFPPSPLGFGELVVDARSIPVLQTAYGPIRIITPTLSILDRLAAYWYHKDSQCWDQAVMVARNQAVDWGAIYKWASNEGKERSEIDRLRLTAGI